MAWLRFKNSSAFLSFLLFKSWLGLEKKCYSVFLAHIIYQKSSDFGNHKIYLRVCENEDSWALHLYFDLVDLGVRPWGSHLNLLGDFYVGGLDFSIWKLDSSNL